MPGFDDHTIVPTRRGQVRAALEWVDLFADVLPKVLDRLAQAFRYADVQPGEVVVSQGAAGDQFFVVDLGEFAVSMRSDQGETAQIATLGPGDVFGETALLTNAPRTATVTATSPGRLWTLTAANFQRWLDDVPELRARVTELVRRREIANALMSLQ